MSIVKDSSKKTLLYYLLSFFIPIIVMLISFYKMDIYPFGGQSLLNMDLWGQYFPMYVEQYNNIRELDFSLFSWNGALGFNLLAQSAYYGNSFLNLFLLFFKLNDLVKVFDFIIIAKVGLASLSFCIFLKNKYNKANLLMIPCSVAYSLCAYMLAFITQPMWLDAVMLMPIIILGLERLVLSRKPIVYCTALAVTIFSSFYISFSICIFLVLYFIVFIISHSNRFKFNDVKFAIINFTVFSLIAGGLVAFVLLPIYKSISLTLASDMSSPDKLEWYNPAIEYLSRLFPFAKTTLVHGMPNIYSGAFIFIMIPLFLFNSKILIRKKIAYSSLFVILHISMNLNILDYIWHGFHFPNQLPGRWAFIFSFFVILMTYETLINIKGIKIIGILCSLVLSSSFIIATKMLPEDLRISNKFIIIMIIGMLLYAIFLLANKIFKQPMIKKAAIIAVNLLMVGEVGVNAVKIMPRDVATSNIVSYNNYNDLMGEAVSKFKNDDDDFYRMEMFPTWTFNSGQLYNYKGVAYYSSTMSGNAYNFLRELGCSVYARNVSIEYGEFSPIINSIFSVKYIVDRSNGLEVPQMDEVYSGGNYRVLENKRNLPIAFMVDDNLLEWELKDNNKPIDAQNRFLNAAMGEDINVYEEIPQIAFESENATIIYNDDWSKQYYKKTEIDKPVQLKFGYVSENNQDIYLQHGFKRGEVSVSINGETRVLDIGRSFFKSLGSVNAGDNIEIIFNVSDVSMGLWGVELFALNEEKFSDCYNELSKNSAQIIKATDTKIKCKVNSEGNGVLYTSIPDDGGWSVKCNGERLETLKIGDYLIAVKIPEGENTLEFSYTVPGLKSGIVLSIISLILLVLYVLIKKEKILKSIIKLNKSSEINLYQDEIESQEIEVLDDNGNDTNVENQTE